MPNSNIIVVRPTDRNPQRGEKASTAMGAATSDQSKAASAPAPSGGSQAAALHASGGLSQQPDLLAKQPDGRGHGSEALDDEAVSARYELDQPIGRGGFSVVWRATERQGGRAVAVKRIIDAFRNEDDARRTYREVALQRGCGACARVLPVSAVLRASNARDLHLVTPCMQMDLSHARSVGYETAAAFLPTPLAASRELILAL